MGNDKTMPVLQDSLGEFTKPSDSRITETKKGHIFGPALKSWGSASSAQFLVAATSTCQSSERMRRTNISCDL